MKNERFFRLFFRTAALYNIAAGTATILFPQFFFHLFDLPEVNHVFVMRALGMFVGVYGYGFYLVSTDLYRHRHFALLGLIGKSFGAAGWMFYTMTGEIPLTAVWINVANDVLWIPFILLYLHRLRTISDAMPNNRL